MKHLSLSLAFIAALLIFGSLANASEADNPPVGWQNIPQLPENKEACKLVPALTLFGGGGYVTGVENRGKQHGEGFGLAVGSLAFSFRATQHFIVTPQLDFGLGGAKNGRWTSSLGVLFGGRTYGDGFRLSAGFSWVTYNNLAIKDGGWWLNGVGFPVKMDFKPWDNKYPVFFSIMATPFVGINRGKHTGGGLEFLGAGIGGDLPSPF